MTNENTTAVSLDDLVETALNAHDETAVALLLYADEGGIVCSKVSPGWEVTYDPRTNPEQPWTDDEGNRFATTQVGLA